MLIQNQKMMETMKVTNKDLFYTFSTRSISSKFLFAITKEILCNFLIEKKIDTLSLFVTFQIIYQINYDQ
jgi:hypothetical protein